MSRRKTKPIGYYVLETCEDYEQVLRILEGDVLPAGGILDWANKDQPRALFPTRAEARRAIQRTEHYRKAFSNNQLPEARFCVIAPVAWAPGDGKES